MSSSFIFTGTGFYIVSASQVVPGTVRVKYSAVPLHVSSSGANDALNVANYSLSGPGPYGLVSVSAVSGDPLSYDVILSGPLGAGTWTVNVSNVQTPLASPLSAPTSAVFVVTVSASATSLTAGAENDTPEKIIRKHLNPALKGPNWDALIAGLSRGDDIVWGIAQSAYDQLFLSSASGLYLEKRASDLGITYPSDIGLSEDVFRKYAIRSNSNKLVQQALREILEAFYGVDSLTAYAECELDEPYNFTEALSLDWVLDEAEEFSYTFNPVHFNVSSKAKAIEIALQLTKHMRDGGSGGYCVAYQSPTTGNYRLRIYSGSMGLRSSVRVTGGTAQNVLRFPTYVEVYSSSVTVVDGYTWVHSSPDPLTSRFSLTTVGQGKLNLAAVQTGDYVIIGSDAQANVAGVYEIKNVATSWSGANLTQSFDIETVTPFGSLIQLSNDAYRFFRPTKRTINAGNRTVIVSQTIDGRVDISIPATTQAVSRGPKQAWYSRLNAATDLIQLQRNPAGTVFARTTAAHGLNAGDQVLLDGVEVVPYAPFTYASPAVAYPATQKQPICYSDTLSVPQSPSTEGSLDSSVCKIGTTDVAIFTGGYNTTAGVHSSTSVVSHKITPTTGTAVNSSMDADGQLQHSYAWAVTGSLNTAREGHGQSPWRSDSAYVTGGFQRPSTFLNSTEWLSGGTTWAAGSGLVGGRAGHEQVTAPDGTIYVFGGATSNGVCTNESWYLTSIGTWQTKASMGSRRVNFKAIPINNTQILVTGGRLMGRSAPFDSTMLAQWRLDETAGAAIADTGATYNLTAVNLPVHAPGKIDYCRNFNVATSHATGAGDAAADTALLGEWTATLWFKRAVASVDGEFLSYGGTGADATPAENLLLNIGIDSTDHIRWKWENGAGVDVTGTTTTPFTAVADSNNFAHLAVRKKLNSDLTTYDVSVFVNGLLIGTWTSQANASDGSNGDWWMARNPENAATDFKGYIDNVTVFKKALTNGEIVEDWFRGAGVYQSEYDNSLTPDYGECTNSCEIYDTVSDTWTPTSSMSLGRAYHEMVLLDDGRVVVLGGVGKDPTQFPAVFQGTSAVTSLDNQGITPNRALKECEIWDPVTGKWQFIDSMGVARKGLAAVKYGSEITVFGGSGLSRPAGQSVYSSPAPVRPEILDLTTLKWRTSPAQSVRLNMFDSVLGASGYGDGSERTRASGFTTNTVIVSEDNRGRGNITGTQQPYELYVGAAHATSSGGLNGMFRVASAPSSTTFTLTPLDATEFVYPMNVRNPSITVSSLTRSGGNTVTATCSSTSSLSIGGLVQVNVSEVADFPSGIKTIATIPTPSTFTYTEVGANTTTSVSGTVTILETAPTSTEAESKSQPANDPGPFIFDPDSGISITGTQGTLAVTAISAGQQKAEIEITVTSTTDFPDSGWVVFDFGLETQSLPIRYYSFYTTTGSNIKLIIDYSYVFTSNYALGSNVSLVSAREGFQPQSLVGAAYLTGSSVGRAAAQAATLEALAAGVDPNITVVYPGDRGLGAEGYPTKLATKISDIVGVFAGDDIDQDVDKAREGN